MTDLSTLFREAWDSEVEKRREQSPSFKPEEYTATGRAAAKYGGKRNTEWWLEHGPTMVESWLNWRQETGWAFWEVAGKPAIELEVNFELPGLAIPIKAFIDRVFVLPSGEPAVVDLKTGRTPETAEQLGFYAVAIEIVHGLKIRWGYFWSPEKGHGQPYDLSRYTPEYFAHQYNEAADAINAGCFLPVPANACRNWCGVARYCHAVGGPEAPGHDPLAGPMLTMTMKENA